eukprot:TRINITY_DN11691_c0_g1_i10.p1 TRINITY_DN11691_c0_g1~~TRINITY_DN11691_c0_g1_i10.p1  ORF type:complete len:123 (+),score=2.11 TRINITY_DN11691_c0_g1_i10:1000-1368(+)
MVVRCLCLLVNLSKPSRAIIESVQILFFQFLTARRDSRLSSRLTFGLAKSWRNVKDFGGIDNIQINNFECPAILQATCLRNSADSVFEDQLASPAITLLFLLLLLLCACVGCLKPAGSIDQA